MLHAMYHFYRNSIYFSPFHINVILETDSLGKQTDMSQYIDKILLPLALAAPRVTRFRVDGFEPPGFAIVPYGFVKFGPCASHHPPKNNFL